MLIKWVSTESKSEQKRKLASMTHVENNDMVFKLFVATFAMSSTKNYYKHREPIDDHTIHKIQVTMRILY